jgi:hypothetical protein
MIEPGEPGRRSWVKRHPGLAAVAAAVVLLLALVAGVASAGITRASGVEAGRTYAGTIARSTSNHINGGPAAPIDVSVSANARTATVIATYSPCPERGIHYPERAFPSARITDGAFTTTTTTWNGDPTNTPKSQSRDASSGTGTSRR